MLHRLKQPLFAEQMAELLAAMLVMALILIFVFWFMADHAMQSFIYEFLRPSESKFRHMADDPFVSILGTVSLAVVFGLVTLVVVLSINRLLNRAMLALIRQIAPLGD